MSGHSTFLFLVSSRTNATELARQLERDGFAATIRPGDGEGAAFQVHARSSRRIHRQKIDRFVDETLEPLARRYGGTVAGWTREGRWMHEVVGIQRISEQNRSDAT
jgi:hypothetical protein